MKPLFFFIIGLLGGVLFTSTLAASSASVIMYHRFGEAEFPSTNTSIEQLNEHITELTSNQYTVLPLEKIVVKLNHHWIRLQVGLKMITVNLEC